MSVSRMDPLEMQPCIMSARLDTCLLLNEVLKRRGLTNSADLAGAANQKHDHVDLVVCSDRGRLHRTAATDYTAHT